MFMFFVKWSSVINLDLFWKQFFLIGLKITTLSYVRQYFMVTYFEFWGLTMTYSDKQWLAVPNDDLQSQHDDLQWQMMTGINKMMTYGDNWWLLVTKWWLQWQMMTWSDEYCSQWQMMTWSDEYCTQWQMMTYSDKMMTYSGKWWLTVTKWWHTVTNDDIQWQMITYSDKWWRTVANDDS
jgi:hypothetical protein